MLEKKCKIYVAGHHGLVGSAIWNNLKARGYENLVGRSHHELDLLDRCRLRSGRHQRARSGHDHRAVRMLEDPYVCHHSVCQHRKCSRDLCRTELRCKEI